MSFRYAGFWVRAIAEWIDLAILVVAGTAVELAVLGAMYWIHGSQRRFADAFGPEFVQLSVTAATALCAFVYFTFAHHRPGFTLGQRVLGIEVVQVSDGGRISLARSAFRTAVSVLSAAALGAGYWLAALHPERRTFHDLVAGTAVVVVAKPPAEDRA